MCLLICQVYCDLFTPLGTSLNKFPEIMLPRASPTSAPTLRADHVSWCSSKLPPIGQIWSLFISAFHTILPLEITHHKGNSSTMQIPWTPLSKILIQQTGVTQQLAFLQTPRVFLRPVAFRLFFEKQCTQNSTLPQKFCLCPSST